MRYDGYFYTPRKYHLFKMTHLHISQACMLFRCDNRLSGMARRAHLHFNHVTTLHKICVCVCVFNFLLCYCCCCSELWVWISFAIASVVRASVSKVKCGFDRCAMTLKPSAAMHTKHQRHPTKKRRTDDKRQDERNKITHDKTPHSTLKRNSSRMNGSRHDRKQ